MSKKLKILYIPGLNSNGENNEFSDDIVQYHTAPNFMLDVEKQIEKFISDRESIKLIGNSFGGWIALKLFKRYDIPTFVINPLLDTNDMNKFIGPQTNFDTGEKYEIKAQLVAYMNSVDQSLMDTITEQHYLFGAVSGQDVILNHEKINNIISTHNILYLPNSHHRITHYEKNTIKESSIFKEFLSI